jgi:hypothetical protein
MKQRSLSREIRVNNYLAFFLVGDILAGEVLAGEVLEGEVMAADIASEG